MTNQLAVYNRTTQLLAADSTVEIKEAARKLMRLTPGGNRLDADIIAGLPASFYSQTAKYQDHAWRRMMEAATRGERDAARLIKSATNGSV